mmetsp:Transcript_58839/g.156639  ORF Transcript_58839/g.156639 Transcript_58839/m.156639 type:complete len:92 (+) Transcript_58839:164-439(+)
MGLTFSSLWHICRRRTSHSLVGGGKPHVGPVSASITQVFSSTLELQQSFACVQSEHGHSRNGLETRECCPSCRRQDDVAFKSLLRPRDQCM